MKVVIVGAGVAGLAIGWRLRQQGAEVTVLERAQAGRGATWAAAGMIAATAELDQSSPAETALAERSRLLWPNFAQEIEAASGMAIFYRRSGALVVALTADEADRMAARPAQSVNLRWLSREAAREMEPMLSDATEGALWAADEAQVDNRALGPALATAFLRAGGDLVVNETVVRFEIERDRVVAARTPFNVHRADAFVLAAGAWSGLIDGLPPAAVPPVRPMKGEMLALVPARGDAPPRCLIWGNGVYLVPRGDRLLVGATLEDAGFDTALTDTAEDWLATRAVSLMPELGRWAIDEHWAGLRPASPDGMPILGPSAVEGLYVATGQYRHGILFAPAIGEILSRSVLERSHEMTAFDPRRFAPALAPKIAVR